MKQGIKLESAKCEAARCSGGIFPLAQGFSAESEMNR